MINDKELEKMAKNRLKDAIILNKNERYEGSYYICGYSIEIALKKKICTTLGWSGFPENNGEFQKMQCLKTHNLESLLLFSGLDKHIRQNFMADWSFVVEWNPEIRYSKPDIIKNIDSDNMIESSKKLMKEILK